MPMPTQEADAKREQRGCRAGWSPPAWFLLAALQSLTGDLHSRMLQQAWGYKCLKMKSANTENKGGNNRSQVAYKRHKNMESKDMHIQERILTAGNCWKSNVRWSSCEAPGLWSVCNIFCVSAFLSYLLRPALYSNAQFWIQQKKKQRKRLIINKIEQLQVLSNWKLELHSIAKIRLNKLKQFKFISHCNNSAVYPFMQLFFTRSFVEVWKLYRLKYIQASTALLCLHKKHLKLQQGTYMAYGLWLPCTLQKELVVFLSSEFLSPHTYIMNFLVLHQNV